MEIIDGIEIIGLGLHIKSAKTLVIADVHIGYEEAMARIGITLPRSQFKELASRIENMLYESRPDTVVITGDLKHEFARISEQEWRDVLRFLDILERFVKKIIFVSGNHDANLGPIAKKRKMEIIDHHIIRNGKEKIYICHGHAIPSDIDFASASTVIIGHEHPAVSISDGIREEKYKCFLKGKWKSKTLIVLPSVNPLAEGTDIQEGNLLSPFLQQKLGNYEVFVSGGDGTLYFGKLKDVR